MGMLLMSVKERLRLRVLAEVSAGSLSLSLAALKLGLSSRQLRRLRRGYEQDGDAGLVHRLRGQPSNRKSDEAVRTKVLGLCREKFVGFGPTLVSEYLLELDERVAVSHDTVRRWQLEAGLLAKERTVAVELNEVRCEHHERKVGRDWCVQWRGTLLQIDKRHEALNLPGKSVTLQDWFGGTVQLMSWQQQALAWRQVKARPPRPGPKPMIVNNQKWTPSAHHPWKAGIAERIKIASLPAPHGGPEENPPGTPPEDISIALQHISPCDLAKAGESDIFPAPPERRGRLFAGVEFLDNSIRFSEFKSCLTN